jgi:hypothetical protein
VLNSCLWLFFRKTIYCCWRQPPILDDVL